MILKIKQHRSHFWQALNGRVVEVQATSLRPGRVAVRLQDTGESRFLRIEDLEFSGPVQMQCFYRLISELPVWEEL